MKHFAYIVIFLLLTSCHTTKNVSLSSASVCDSTNVNTAYTSSSYDANLANSLNLVLDSLDIWIYDYPFGSGRVLPADTSYQPEAPINRDIAQSKGSIHITAKKAALDKSGTTEIHSANDSLSTSISTAHSENAESADTQSDSTTVAKPPNLTWVLIVGVLAAMIIASIIIYFRRS